jgi:hypothetical protein
MLITDSADNEVCSVIGFFNVKNIHPAKIQYQLVEGVMNEGNVCDWCPLFHKGRTGLHNEAQFGCLPVITDDLRTGVHAS